MTTPTSQKSDQRPIGFTLLQNGQIVPGGQLTLIIRPEELSRDEPSRLSVQQTIGGAYLDHYGVGISTISIQGNTGWRAGIAEDGGQHFQRLRASIFHRWHELREEQQGRGDPDRVEMIFTDTLDEIAVVVAPQSFRLQRSKTKPLLYQYAMKMVVLRDAAVPPVPVAEFERRSAGRVGSAAMEALATSMITRAALAAEVRTLFDPATRVLADLVDGSAAILGAVMGLTQAGIDAFDAVSAPVIFASRQVELATRNLVQALIEPLALTERIKRTLREVYSNAAEAYCNLTNSFQPNGQYLDFTGLFGASNCSSTTGGRPLSDFAGENPFLSLYPSRSAPVMLSLDAQSAINEATQDVLILQTRSPQSLMDLVRRISAGIVVEPVA
ncbi:hypothetical protein [Nevskia sp.]|uniref:hypothetical protein n=1 Tax=Nevskia sp. TaxID=1929292 RepID=UPI0025E0D804|nr:hypothetical protein [Nevskia sp.]